jgi:signal transduction histidine kinase
MKKSFLDLRPAILYTTGMNFQNSRLQIMYKILIAVVAVVVLISTVVQYQNLKERIESKFLITYNEIRSSINRITATAFDPYSLFLKLYSDPLRQQDTQEIQTYIEKFLEVSASYQNIPFITAVGFSTSPELDDYREFNRSTQQWKIDTDKANLLKNKLPIIPNDQKADLKKQNIEFFPDPSNDMIQIFYQIGESEKYLFLTLTVDFSTLYDEEIIPRIEDLYKDYEFIFIPGSIFTQSQFNSLTLSHDSSYSFTIASLFSNSGNRVEWLIPLPKQVLNFYPYRKTEDFPEKEKFRIKESLFETVSSLEDLYLLVDIQTNGKSLFSLMERKMAADWLMGGFLLLLSIGAAFIILLLQLIKIQQQQFREREFVASITHELKTPLTIIQSAAENLKRGVVPEDRLIQYGQHLDEQTKRLTTMIDEILLYSQLEAKTLKKAPLSAVDPQQLVDAITTDFSGLKKEISIHLDTTSLPNEAMMDGESLAVILRNLLLNALLHAYPAGESGNIKVSAWLKIPNKLVFSIEDDGEGIPGSDLHRIFQPFYRSKRSKNQQISGSGLGLFLALKKANIMHGSLRLTTPYLRKNGDKSFGCRFVLQIPYIAPDDGKKTGGSSI